MAPSGKGANVAIAGRDQDLVVELHTREIDLTHADEFASELEAAVESAVHHRVQRLILDYREVDFMDSGGIGALLDARGRLAEKGCRLELREVQRPVLRAIEVLGLTTTFAVT